ncbi:hypothetical protein [Streptosporangium sp. NPDC000509]|uniref:hypothetical protein n=1 Tax=Streptosporangium sp. NPDC000509 TaxID=3366186 RepID=UPI00367585E4
MKRYIAGLACAATAMLGVPALASTAHAQAADPVSALKKQFKSGHGVAYVDTIKRKVAGKSTVFGKRKGEFQFNASGITASDHTTEVRFTEEDLGLGTGSGDSNGEKTADEERFEKLLAGLAEPERVVRVNKKAYVGGGAFGQFLPRDKPWLGSPEDTLGLTGSMGQFVNIAEPATLKALLARATVKRSNAYAGQITSGELQKVSPWFRVTQGRKLTGQETKVKISWKLFLNANRLPVRLATSYTTFKNGPTFMVDTSYSAWGSEVAITAPPADQVATMKELDAGFLADTPIPLIAGK